jgi:hypothetical protein
VQQNLYQPVQDFIDRMSAPPNPKGPLYPPPPIQIALQAIGGFVDQRFLGGKITQTAQRIHSVVETFLARHPSLQSGWNIARNTLEFGNGFVSQILDDATIGLYGRLTRLQWSTSI